MTQIVVSVSESLALMLQKQPTAQAVWDTLLAEMTKKPKMVVTSLQQQLTDEDNFCEHLDKALHRFARLNEMGAAM